MAVDDPEADPSTHALASDHAQLRLAERQLALYRRELQAYWSFATPKKMGFLFWHSGAEQVLRYHAVKENAFAYAPEIPDGLLDRRDPYAAYLLENIMPGTSKSLQKSASVMFSTEGCVSSLFYRWESDHEIGSRFLDESFYERFGAVRSSISPVENAYLKLFHAIHTGRSQDTGGVIAAYKTAFPEEAQIVDRIVDSVLLGQPPSSAPAIWLANPDFKTGTGLFDQFRAVPRVHTFDLNAATLIDLLGVPGIDRALAARILQAGPFSDLSGLEGVQGIGRPLMERFKFMAREMERLKIGDEDSAFSSLPRVVVSYLWRALVVLVVASVSGGMFYRRVRRSGLFRSMTNGLAVSFLVVALSWGVVGAEGLSGYLLPVLIFGLASMLFQLARRRWKLALPELLAWGVAALPAKLLTYPWF
jgi:DNA uptake protein ComE-like DNA-binding protein